MNPKAEVEPVFRLGMDNCDVTPISYGCDYLAVDRGDGRLRTFPENRRGFNRGHANFARALGKSLLVGLLVRCVVVIPLD